MFDDETFVEAPAAYSFQVRLILAKHSAIIGESEQHILDSAFAMGRSAVESAAGFLSGHYRVQTVESIWGRDARSLDANSTDYRGGLTLGSSNSKVLAVAPLRL